MKARNIYTVVDPCRCRQYYMSGREGGKRDGDI